MQFFWITHADINSKTAPAAAAFLPVKLRLYEWNNSCFVISANGFRDIYTYTLFTKNNYK